MPKNLVQLQQLIKYLNANEMFVRKIDCRKIDSTIRLDDMNWIDAIRAKLGHAGYIKQVGTGTYKRIKEIPEDMTPQQLTLKAYGSNMKREDLLKKKKHCRPEWNGWYNGIIYGI